MEISYSKALAASPDNQQFRRYCFELLHQNDYFVQNSRCKFEQRLDHVYRKAYEKELIPHKKVNAAMRAVNLRLVRVCAPYGFEGLVIYKRRLKEENNQRYANRRSKNTKGGRRK